MSSLKETVYAGRNNAIRLLLNEDGVAFDVAYPDVDPTQWVLTINTTPAITIDSDVNPEAFDWNKTTSVLELRLGLLLSTAFNYTTAILTVYSAAWPEGMVWVNPTCTPDKLLIRVCDQV
jgi:hypothetical protein